MLNNTINNCSIQPILTHTGTQYFQCENRICPRKEGSQDKYMYQLKKERKNSRVSTDVRK